MAGIDPTEPKPRFLRIAAWCGLAGPVTSAAMIFHSITVSPWFNWHRDALSKIGVSANAIWFNAGVFVGGVLTAVLAVGVGRWIGRGWLGRVGCAAVLLGAIALALVGVFPEDRGRLHFLVATTYFLVTPLGYMLLGMAMLRKGLRVHGALTVCAGVAALLALTQTPHDGYAVPEILASLIVDTWTFSMGMNLLVGDSVLRAGGEL
jgi:hypothetical membrane protein